MSLVAMILNERELREARSKIEALDEALSSERALLPMIQGLPPEVVVHVTRAMIAERDELRRSVDDYESAKNDRDHRALAERAGTDPGLTLIVARISKGLSQRDLAWRLGLKEQQIQRYESDRYASISIKNYQRIASVLGVRLSSTVSDFRELSGLDHMIDDVSRANLKKILKHGRDRGWFSDDASEADLWTFIAANRIAFGSPSLLRTGLNVKDHSDDILLHAWRARVASRASQTIDRLSSAYIPLALQWLPELVRLSAKADGPLLAKAMLEDHGIVLIVESQIPGLTVDGAAFIERDHPVIGMTLRHDTVDGFWFTLLHELAHAVLHFRTGLSVGYFDQDEASSIDEQEKEADRFASNVLIPEELWRRSAARISNSVSVIEKFAQELRISPAIVFGRIRKERDDYSLFSGHIGRGKVRRLFAETNDGSLDDA